MFCRAKIGVALALAGTLTGWAAPLNFEQKNPALSRDGLVVPAVIKPSQTNKSLSTRSRWRGLKVQKITPASQTTKPVAVNGFLFAKAEDAKHPPALISPVAPAAKK